MALDFFDINDIKREHLLFSIDNLDLDLIDDAFLELQNRIGNTINIYGTSRIYKSHVDLLISLIREEIENKNKIKKKQRLLNILEKLSVAKEGFIVIGD